MEKFTASNGVRFEFRPEGLSWATDLYPEWKVIGAPIPPIPILDSPTSTPGFGSGSLIDDALVEFYRAREDERLGRWRHPERSHLVVYKRSTQGVITVVDETTGATWRGSADSMETDPKHMGLAEECALAYFAAHPARPAWADAEVISWWPGLGARIDAIAQREGLTWFAAGAAGVIEEWTADELADLIGDAQVKVLVPKGGE